MPKTNRSPALENRTSRARIAKGRRVAVAVGDGLALLYRRGVDRVGSWQGRRWNGTSYVFAALGEADDLRDADGVAILDYWQAFERARAWAKESAGRIAGDTVAVPGYGTVGDALDAYLADYTKRGGRAIAYTRGTVERMIRPELGHLRLTELTAAHLRKWLHTAASRGRTKRPKRGKEPRREPAPTSEDRVRARRATANRIYNMLRAALNFAYREGMVASDAAWRRTRPFQKVDEARVRYLTNPEATALVEACSPDLRRLVRAALLTGARFGELAALRIGDFNDKAKQVYLAPRKSGRARYVPLNTEGLRLFRELTAGRPAEAFALLRANGEPWRTQLYVRPLKAASAVAKIAPACTFHELRHTYASLLAQAGADLLTISKLLGHADTRVTSRHYAHLCDKTLADTVQALLPQFGTGTKAKVVPFHATKQA